MSDTELTIIDATSTMLPDTTDMHLAGQMANRYAETDVFHEYHKELAANTITRQRHDLALFCLYLKEAGVSRTAEKLYNDPEQWHGVTYGLVKGFRVWLEQSGRAIGSINVHLATIRKYCELLYAAEVLSIDELRAIQSVKSKNGKKARNLDEQREEAGINTRIGKKKALATEVTTAQVFKLKKKTTVLGQHSHDYGKFLAARDALLMGLIFENALRCGEVVALNLEHFNLSNGTMTFYREKTDKTETHELKKHTRIAAETYISMIHQGAGDWLPARDNGPLFTGYKGKRVSKRTINARVGILGKEEGIKKLSPHDARHFWTYDALRNGTSLDKVKSGGGWASNEMPLRYAQRSGIANENVTISEE